MEKLAGVGLLIGAVLFIIAAFTPLTYRVVLADVQQRVEIIQNERTGWIIVNILFGLGSVIVVIGLALFAQHIQTLDTSSIVKIGGYLGVATASLGVLFWVIIVYNRAALSPEQVASSLSINDWIFPAYTLLTQITLIIVGFVLMQSGYPAWMGWGSLGLGVLSIAAYLIFKDMPPFAHYVPLLIMGIALVL